MELDPKVVDQIRRIARRHGILKVAVFGSRARHDARDDSDLDLLIHVQPGTSLLDLLKLENAFERELGMKIDLVTDKGLHPRIRDKVMRERVPIIE